MSDPTSHLRARLRALDPAGNTDAYDKETLMSLIDRTTRRAEATRPDPIRRRPRLLATAAAAVCVAAAVVVAYVVVGHGSAGRVAANPPASMAELQLPPGAGPAGGICLQYSIDQLKDTSAAFSGVATAVTTDRVVLTVDHWYRGGSAARVELAKPSDGAADNSITWNVGARYLIAATTGTVDVCGSSGAWNAELAADYAQVFAG